MLTREQGGRCEGSGGVLCIFLNYNSVVYYCIQVSWSIMTKEFSTLPFSALKNVDIYSIFDDEVVHFEFDILHPQLFRVLQTFTYRIIILEYF